MIYLEEDFMTKNVGFGVCVSFCAFSFRGRISDDLLPLIFA